MKDDKERIYDLLERLIARKCKSGTNSCDTCSLRVERDKFGNYCKVVQLRRILKKNGTKQSTRDYDLVPEAASLLLREYSPKEARPIVLEFLKNLKSLEK